MTDKQTNAELESWLDKEFKEVNKKANFDGEKLPSLQFEEKKIVAFDVDFANPFGEYDDKENKAVKAIIPVSQKGEKKILWLNKKNPLYKDIISAGKNGQTSFKVMQVGNKAHTKYNLVEE